jgi:REP element-mobilizing transposase RayT
MIEELKSLPPEARDSEKSLRIDALLDTGYGSCCLQDPIVATTVQNCLFWFNGQRYSLYCWVIMPNHVHVLFQPINGWTLSKIVASWKKFTARDICDYRRRQGANLSVGLANQEIGAPKKMSPVWQREYWDRCIRDERHFRCTLEYIINNPVKAGLVSYPEDWKWSSAGADPKFLEAF